MRFANFASNAVGLAVYAMGGYVIVAAGPYMGVGQFLESRRGRERGLRIAAMLSSPALAKRARENLGFQISANWLFGGNERYQ
jgi:hypothetical protein